MNNYTKPVSIIDLVSPSINHTRAILSAPLNLKRWLAIGVCAWLATLGEGVGPNLLSEEYNETLNQFQNTLASHPMLLGALLIFGIAITAMVIWISSRGRFMFYHCVLYNSDQIAHPWHYYQHLAASLFRFRLVLAIVGILLGIAFMGLTISTGGPAFQISDLPEVLPESAFVMPLLLVALGLLICDMLTNDFVIPVMHRHTLTCTAAWSYVWLTVGARKVNIFRYLLFRALVAMAVGFAFLLLGLITRGGIYQVLIIPYVGTVLLLPIATFKRAFSLLYLRQFGPDFDAFAPEPVSSEDDPEQAAHDYSI
jgi:hypothetical protein